MYLVQAIVLRWGLQRRRYQRTRNQPTVSILVAARNEENNLAACLESLVEVDYPRELLEVLVLDDSSSDRTLEIAQWYEARYPFVRAIHLTGRVPGLSGKASAICQGLDESQGEIVLVTDADCVVPRTWVRSYVSYYTPEVGIVGGFTLLDRAGERVSLFAKIQSVDWVYLLTVGAGAAGLGKPVSVLGNNFSFRRAAYDAVGGYRNLGFSIIEDFTLMQAVVQHTDWQVCFPLDRGTAVYSKPMSTLSDFYHQRKRWAAGGKEVSLFGKSLMAAAFFTHLLLPLNLATPSLLPLGAAGILAVLGVDALLLWSSTSVLQRRDLLRYLLAFEAFYFLYTTFFAPVVLFPTTVLWKGVRYEWETSGQIKQIADAAGAHPRPNVDDS
jgi:cellulose synthase/poly-beta-1,6-N-acetylglucosamine synthase-like glycosyltransferase